MIQDKVYYYQRNEVQKRALLKTIHNDAPETVDERVSRRSYLKYLVAVAVVAGVAAISAYGFCQYYRKHPSPSPTISPTPTPSPTTPSPTPTVELTSLHGRLFFDYNGNGLQDSEEPTITNARILLKDNTGEVIAETVTDSAGDYKLEDFPTGSYGLYVEADEKFRHMCQSTEESRVVEEGYDVLLNEPKKMDIGLMEGFLTLPFSSSVPVEVADYFDHDPGIDGMWWNGRRLSGSRGHHPPWTHPGIDFLIARGTEVKAAVSGKTVGINTVPGQVYWISLLNENGYGTSYLHIDKPLVSTGMRVKRGQPIALSGETGSPGSPHLEFQLWRHMPDDKYYCIDPYSPVAGVPRGAWIAGSWEWYPSDEEWVSQGYWTKFNEPQYSL